MKVIVRCEKTIIRSMRLVGGHVELSGVRGFKQVLGVVGTMDFLFGLSVCSRWEQRSTPVGGSCMLDRRMSQANFWN